jgi:hypothetical protein
MGYYFKPMMPFYARFASAPTEWLMSQEGRDLIGKAVKLCRTKYGNGEAKRFINALTYVGCIYPINGFLPGREG